MHVGSCYILKVLSASMMSRIVGFIGLKEKEKAMVGILHYFEFEITNWESRKNKIS